MMDVGNSRLLVFFFVTKKKPYVVTRDVWLSVRRLWKFLWNVVAQKLQCLFAVT